ncbi:MAG: hypothetical protein LBB12_03915 [Holosporaceae bacterium]|nr:hypothetical protein [Holosporaceae bacterium]
MTKRILNLIYNIHFVIFLAFMGSLLMLLRMIICDEINLNCNSIATDYILYTATSVVMGIAFLVAAFLRKTKVLYADILKESVLYNISLLGSICGILVAIIYTIYLYFSEADQLQILNSNFGLIGMFFIISYLLMERKLLNAGQFTTYYWIISIFIILSVGGVLGAVHRYAPLSAIRTLQKDKNIRDTVMKIVKNIRTGATVPTDLTNILKTISKSDNQAKKNIAIGNIKYKKINDEKFSLSWKLYTNFNLAKNSKRLNREYGYIINSLKNSHQKRLEEFHLDPAKDQNKTLPEVKISEKTTEQSSAIPAKSETTEKTAEQSSATPAKSETTEKTAEQSSATPAKSETTEKTAEQSPVTPAKSEATEKTAEQSSATPAESKTQG